MPKYCVDKQPQENGDHKVHKYICNRLPFEGNRKYLGVFDNCFDALREAKKYYDRSVGCHYCSPECQTTRLGTPVSKNNGKHFC